ncbi:MAG: hypothetical protein H6532_07965 [Thermoleophilales bacterium]|nr:hypothetical protein [Thermoleophilales bacterium]
MINANLPWALYQLTAGEAACQQRGYANVVSVGVTCKGKKKRTATVVWGRVKISTSRRPSPGAA